MEDQMKNKTHAIQHTPAGRIARPGHLLLGFLIVSMLAPLAVAAQDASPSPQFYDVRTYGAVGDGAAKDMVAVQKTIDACAEAGGGTVLFPAGTYLCGSVHLRSNVTLQLNAGATILASKDKDDFDPYETLDYENDADHETTYMHYSLLWGEGVHNVAIVGQGTIDGNREKRGGPKPIAVKRGQHITVTGISIINAPNYCISLLGCDYVNIDGVTILNAYCDGIDPDSCRHVRIANCHIESWDDAIVLKSSFALGERRATEYVTVTNCVLSSHCNAFKLGTESGGGFRYITASNLVMFSPEKRRTRSGIALESVDGAVVEGIAVSNVTMHDVHTPIFLRLGNRGRDMETPVPGTLRDISISHIVATGATMSSSITGLPGHPVQRVSLEDINIEYLGGKRVDEVQQTVPEVPADYPEAKMFGELPTYGLYCRHVEGLSLRGLDMRYAAADERPALICDDVERLRVSALAATTGGHAPYIQFQNVREAILEGIVAPSGTGTFLQVSGNGTRNVRILSSDLSAAKQAFDIAPDVEKSQLVETANRLPPG